MAQGRFLLELLSACAVGLSAALPCSQNHVFVDLGANDGQSLTWFARHWVPRAVSKFTSVVAFEMNPVFAPVLQTLLKPWGGELVAAAAWTSDGSMAATLQQPGSRTAVKGGVMYNMTSSALEVGGVPLNKHAGDSRRRGAHAARTSVPTIDLSRWLSERYCAADTVDVKMDIEGAEFEVLEHLIRTGAAARVDTLAIEWHTHKRGRGGLRMALQERQRRIEQALGRMGVKLIKWGDARAQ